MISVFSEFNVIVPSSILIPVSFNMVSVAYLLSLVNSDTFVGITILLIVFSMVSIFSILFFCSSVNLSFAKLF